MDQATYNKYKEQFQIVQMGQFTLVGPKGLTHPQRSIKLACNSVCEYACINPKIKVTNTDLGIITK